MIFENIFSIEQILGYVASFILLIGYAIKSDVKTKTVLIFSSLFFATHFYLLGAFTAMAICLVNSMRNVSSIFFYKSKVMFVLFITLYGAGGIFTYHGAHDLLPLLAAIITCVGMFFLTGIRFRMLVVIATLLWVVHNVYAGSIGGTINSIILFFISSSVVFKLHKESILK